MGIKVREPLDRDPHITGRHKKLERFATTKHGNWRGLAERVLDMYSADMFEMEAYLDEISYCARDLRPQAEEFACTYRTWLDEVVMRERNMTSRVMAACFCASVGAQGRYPTFSFHYFSQILYNEEIKFTLLKLHKAALRFRSESVT